MRDGETTSYGASGGVDRRYGLAFSDEVVKENEKSLET
jgi:hypothetical protein